LKRPFNEARYKRLLEGLEISELKLSEILLQGESVRLDPEYFNRDALKALMLIQGDSRLGDFVQNGYRVVYESTNIIERIIGEHENLPYFLQAEDIATPFINKESMACVAQSDWERYPKGRIQPGELLIEVKGKAEKIALVPDDFPTKTLVTGTCFKLTTKNPTDKYMLAAYLTCRYGQVLKDRLKTNLLVSYLAKDDLYSLPVPELSLPLKEKIRDLFISCFEYSEKSDSLLKQSDNILSAALGLSGWTPPEPLTYTRRASAVFDAERLDSDFFTPRTDELFKRFGKGAATIGEIAPARREKFIPADNGTFNYIEISDICNNGTTGSTTISMQDAPSRATWHVHTGDILTSTVRPIRRLSCIINKEQNGFIASSGFVVLKPEKVPPEVLLTYLRLPLFCELMDLHTSASLYPAISDSDLLSLPFPKISLKAIADITQCVRNAHSARETATTLLDTARRAVEIAIEDSESAALAWLEQHEIAIASAPARKRAILEKYLT
jgi:restriction endonuclease S subunit